MDGRGSALLVWETEPGKAYVLRPHDSPLTLGRDGGCDVVILDPGASGLHARLQIEGPFWVWEDRSTHGTEFISASHAVELVRREPRRLRHGDRLFIGEAVLRFEQPSVDPAIPALTPPMEPPVEITGRQMDVLEELSRPLREPGGGAPASNAEICAALFITQNTLREHLGELYLRFGLTEDSGTSTQRRVRLAAAWRRARRR